MVRPSFWADRQSTRARLRSQRGSLAILPTHHSGVYVVNQDRGGEETLQEKDCERQEGVLLYAGDLDPSGWGIYENICNKFSDDGDIELRRFALNPG